MAFTDVSACDSNKTNKDQNKDQKQKRRRREDAGLGIRFSQ